MIVSKSSPSLSHRAHWAGNHWQESERVRRKTETPDLDRVGECDPTRDAILADELSVRRITNLSPEAIVENYADKVRRLSAKRVGMSLGDALEIASGKAKSAT